MSNTDEKLVQKLLQLLKDNRITVRKDNENIKIKPPFEKEIIIKNPAIQVDSVNIY